MAVLHDSETYSSANTLVQIKPPCPAALQVMGEYGINPGPSLVDLDPPEHARHRQVFRRSFTPERVAALEPRSRELIDEAIDRVIDRGEADVVTDLVWDAPAKIAFALMGVPGVRGRQDQDRHRAARDDGLGRALRRGAGRARHRRSASTGASRRSRSTASSPSRARTSWATSSAPGRSRATRRCSAATSSAGSSSTRSSPGTRRRRTPRRPASARSSPTATSGRRSARTRRSSPTPSRRSCASTPPCRPGGGSPRRP